MTAATNGSDRPEFEGSGAKARCAPANRTAAANAASSASEPERARRPRMRTLPSDNASNSRLACAVVTASPAVRPLTYALKVRFGGTAKSRRTSSNASSAHCAGNGAARSARRSRTRSVSICTPIGVRSALESHGVAWADNTEDQPISAATAIAVFMLPNFTVPSV